MRQWFPVGMDVCYVEGEVWPHAYFVLFLKE